MKIVSSLLLAAAVIGYAAQPKPTKLSSDLAGATANTSVQVIVQWNIDVGANTSQKILAAGGSVVSELSSIRAGTYIVPPSALGLLSKDPDVKFVSVDRKIHHKLAMAAAAINAPAVWNSGFVGTGIGIAVVDSGINSDSNLAAGTRNLLYTEDFVTPITGNSGSKPASYGLDWYGHGQHVAGIIASNGKDSACGNCNKSFVGIAPGANLLNLKVLDSNGEGSDGAVIAAIDRAIALKNTYNIRVMNLSLGRPVYESYTQGSALSGCRSRLAGWYYRRCGGR